MCANDAMDCHEGKHIILGGRIRNNQHVGSLSWGNREPWQGMMPISIGAEAEMADD